MKKYLGLISFVLFLFVLLAFSGFAGEKIELEVAQRAAEYHGELIFEKDLKICDHELMFWPSGEEAVYVFTLMGEDEVYPDDVFISDDALQGVYLALSGQFDEGYDLMAQPDRYMTVVVGADMDMPSFLKAHAGLPEHILYLKLMETPSYDPYFIYVDLFHTCVGSKLDQGYPYSQVTEIHLGKTVALSDLLTEKICLVPDHAQEHEWGSFLHPGQVLDSSAPSYFIDLGAVKEGKHQLNVKEYAKARYEGCSPAAFVNCLKYLESQGKVKTKGKSIRKLLEWTAICYRTDPSTKGTAPSWILKGSKLMFKGLGYKPNVSEVTRQNNKPGLFLTKFAREINAKYPVNLGGGTGVFNQHSTTGIGYWKQYKHIRLIIHDGWAGSKPVYVKYSGYPTADCEYPTYMRKFHPKGARNYPESQPMIKAPIRVLWDKVNLQWRWKYSLKSKNAVKAGIYIEEYKYFNSNGNQYHKIKGKRELPYWKGGTLTLPKPFFKRGKVQCKYYLVDYNGHLLEVKKTVRIEDIIGTWKMNFNWKDIVGGSVTWTVNKNGTFNSSGGGSGTWNLNKRTVTFNYQTGQKPVYSGRVNPNFSKMSGSMKMTTGTPYKGTWDATRQSDGLSLYNLGEQPPKIISSSSDDVVKKE
jgi:hypothetical protein